MDALFGIENGQKDCYWNMMKCRPPGCQIQKL